MKNKSAVDATHALLRGLPPIIVNSVVCVYSLSMGYDRWAIKLGDA